jgi:hypothetical protein
VVCGSLTVNASANVVLVGPNGVGKSMLARNLAHQALILGRTVLFTSAGQLLGDLASLDSDAAMRRCGVACSTTPRPICWPLTKLAISRIQTAMPTCCSVSDPQTTTYPTSINSAILSTLSKRKRKHDNKGGILESPHCGNRTNGVLNQRLRKTARPRIGNAHCGWRQMTRHLPTHPANSLR